MLCHDATGTALSAGSDEVARLRQSNKALTEQLAQKDGGAGMAVIKDELDTAIQVRELTEKVRAVSVGELPLPYLLLFPLPRPQVPQWSTSPPRCCLFHPKQKFQDAARRCHELQSEIETLREAAATVRPSTASSSKDVEDLVRTCRDARCARICRQSMHAVRAFVVSREHR